MIGARHRRVRARLVVQVTGHGPRGFAILGDRPTVGQMQIAGVGTGEPARFGPRRVVALHRDRPVPCCDRAVGEVAVHRQVGRGVEAILDPVVVGVRVGEEHGVMGDDRVDALLDRDPRRSCSPPPACSE